MLAWAFGAAIICVASKVGDGDGDGMGWGTIGGVQLILFFSSLPCQFVRKAYQEPTRAPNSLSNKTAGGDGASSGPSSGGS
jgi:hypothetical protein